MKNNLTQQIESLWADAHPLRGENQITFGAALKKYGEPTVRLAMGSGKVSVSWTVMLTPEEAGDTNAYAGIDDAAERERIKATRRPYQRRDFSFATGRAEMKMEANGVVVA